MTGRGRERGGTTFKSRQTFLHDILRAGKRVSAPGVTVKRVQQGAKRRDIQEWDFRFGSRCFRMSCERPDEQRCGGKLGWNLLQAKEVGGVLVREMIWDKRLAGVKDRRHVPESH
jgi:hypothetical protein